MANSVDPDQMAAYLSTLFAQTCLSKYLRSLLSIWYFSVSCPTLTAPSSGNISLTTDGVTTTTLFSCDVGFSLSGATTLTCLDTGSWNDTTPACSELWVFLLTKFIIWRKYCGCGTEMSRLKWDAAWQNQQNSMCAHQRLRSACADLRLCWAHRSFCWFCHAAARMFLGRFRHASYSLFVWLELG